MLAEELARGPTSDLEARVAERTAAHRRRPGVVAPAGADRCTDRAGEPEPARGPDRPGRRPRGPRRAAAGRHPDRPGRVQADQRQSRAHRRRRRAGGDRRPAPRRRPRDRHRRAARRRRVRDRAARHRGGRGDAGGPAGARWRCRSPVSVGGRDDRGLGEHRAAVRPAAARTARPCCGTPTSRCTGPRRRARATCRSSSRRCTTRRSAGWSCSASSARRSGVTSWRWSSSRSSSRSDGRVRGRRGAAALGARPGGHDPARMRSSRWPRRAA